MPGTAVIGLQWGDEGKGKVSDVLAAKAAYVVRFQGGNNAGHTVVIDGRTHKLHLLPTGILHPACTAVIGNGLVVDPWALAEEIDGLAATGVPHGKLLISDRAHVILPHHRQLDGAEEQAKGALAAGTTRRGIGPAYADKVARFGVRMVDLTDAESLREKLDLLVPRARGILQSYGASPEGQDIGALTNELLAFGSRFKGQIVDTASLLNDALDAGKNVLFEGAQGVQLDIDHGIYPFLTSSNTITAAIGTGAGVPPQRVKRVIGVVKAYTSKVGAGPFPTELTDKIGETLRERGGEYGTTTGRPRRCGWLDLVGIRYAARLAGTTELAITKLDVLSGIDPVRVCVAYRSDGKELTSVPASAKVLAGVAPVYEALPGWRMESAKTNGRRRRAHSKRGLPASLRKFLVTITKHVGVPIHVVSVGPGREETVVL